MKYFFVIFCFNLAVDIKWLGIHSNDLFDEDNRPIISAASLQPWTTADQQIYSGLSTVKEYMVQY